MSRHSQCGESSAVAFSFRSVAAVFCGGHLVGMLARRKVLQATAQFLDCVEL